MVSNIGANRAIIVGDSVPMVMKCKAPDKEGKANKQETDNFSVHLFTNNRHIKGGKWGMDSIFWQGILYFQAG